MLFLGIVRDQGVTSKETHFIKSLVSKHATKRLNFMAQGQLFLAYESAQASEPIGQTTPDETIICLGDCYSQAGLKINTQDINREATATLGDHFVNYYWGNYILIGYNTATKSLSLFRDPIGQSCIFYLKINDHLLFSSDINLLTAFLKQKPCYNMAYFISYINNSFLNTPATPFLNIAELPQGCRVCYKNNAIQPVKPVWNPFKHAQGKRTIKDFNATFMDLMTTLTRVHIRSSDRIVLEYSGGFDSTALLYFLHAYAEGKEIRAINFYDQKVSSSNEFHHAKKVTETLGIALDPLELSSLLPFSPAPYKNSLLPNWPTASMVYQKKLVHITDKYLQPKKQGAILYASGHGGDNIFMCPPFKESIVDYFIDHGLKGLANKIQAFCFLERASLLSLIGPLIQSFSRYYFSIFFGMPLPSAKNDQAPWITEKAHALNALLSTHPLAQVKRKNVTPGKAALIQSILFGLATIKCPFRRNSQVTFYPFFSQPLIELCLSFPVYNTFSSHFDRHHVRSLISGHFKTDYVWRKDKGETSGILQRGLMKNQKRVFELCLEGVFAQKGLIDRTMLHQNLKNLKNGHDAYQWQCSSLFTAELFFDLWQ